MRSRQVFTESQVYTNPAPMCKPVNLRAKGNDYKKIACLSLGRKTQVYMFTRGHSKHGHCKHSASPESLEKAHIRRRELGSANSNVSRGRMVSNQRGMIVKL